MDLQAELAFLAPNKLHKVEKPFKFDYRIRDRIPNAKQTNVEIEKCTVTVHDIRDREAEFDVEKSGFELLHHTTLVPLAKINERDIQAAYMKEAEQILKDRFHASRVIFIGVEIRDNDASIPLGDLLKPASYVHVDQSGRAGIRRLRHMLGQDTADEILKSHKVLIANLWRPCEQVVDMPLALCDTRTTKQADCVAVDVIKHGSYIGEEYSVYYSPDQCFYYISNQDIDEVWLFQMTMWEPGNPDGYFQGCAHAAFEIPRGPGWKPRRSVETRAYVVI